MFTRRQVIAALAAFAGVGTTLAPSRKPMKIQVSANHRFLSYENGDPFFYLADTAWELFHRLNREEADLYLTTRAHQGFTVVQAAALAELDGLHTPNAHGDIPLIDADPTRPNEAYFKHVDFIVQRANALGITVAMLPTWGDKWNKKWGVGPEIFHPENAHTYGAWLAHRYRNSSIIWILGGDRAPETPEHFAIVRAMAAGIRASVGNNQLISLHSWGGTSSGDYFHQDSWLDFNICQTGHQRDKENWRSIQKDYARLPVKPCMDGEPGYENIPDDFKDTAHRLQMHHCRKSLYWALLSGAHGHTYGCNDIWQMWSPAHKSTIFADTPWSQAIHFPGAGQMHHARTLLMGKNFFTRIPDQSVLASATYAGGEYIAAARYTDGTGALIYSAAGKPFTVDMDRVQAAGKITAEWFDPRTGTRTGRQAAASTGKVDFQPPTSGETQDWVLSLKA